MTPRVASWVLLTLRLRRKRWWWASSTSVGRVKCEGAMVDKLQDWNDKRMVNVEPVDEDG